MIIKLIQFYHLIFYHLWNYTQFNKEMNLFYYQFQQLIYHTYQLELQNLSVSMSQIFYIDFSLDDEKRNQLYILLILLFLTFYSIISAYLQHHHQPIHKSSVAIIIGIIVGLIVYLAAQSTYEIITKFNDTIVFSILLPPMLFAQGFTLKKNSILKNIGYISIYGIVGTFLFYIIIVLLLLAANNLNLVRDAHDITNIRTLSIWQILLLGACFCSIDTIASEEAVSPKRFSKLNSIIFGQGIFKDTITIVLFRAILKLQQMQSPKKFIFYWYTSFQILINFFILVICSCLHGIILAFLTAWIFKKLRFLLHDSGVTQTCVLFMLGFSTYLISEILSCSGVISILIYGVTLNHYNIYNMSQKGRQTSRSTFLSMSIICEGFLFLIMGVMVWQAQWSKHDESTQQMTHSYIFSAVVVVILIFGRFFNIVVISLIGKHISKKFKMNRQQIQILFVSGLVKGAVPFALFTSAQINDTSNYGKNEGLVLKSTIIIVVILTSVFLNSLIPKLYKNRLKKLKQYVVEHKNQEIKEQKKQKNKKLKSKFYQIQEKYIKPFLIFDYINRLQEIKQMKIKNKMKSMLQNQKEQDHEDHKHSQHHDKNIDSSILSEEPLLSNAQSKQKLQEE